MHLLTVEMVATLLLVSPTWVYRHRDDIGCIRCGPRLIRFREENVLAYLERMEA